MSRGLNFTTRLTRDDVAGIMEAMMNGMREGLLKVQKSDETLEMIVPRVIDFDVRAALDRDRARCALEISWRPNREENPDMPDADKGQIAEMPETSVGDHARASLREAARAVREAVKAAGLVLGKTARIARKAAKSAGLVLGKTAGDASALVRKRLDRGRAGGGEQDAGGILAQAGAKAETVASRVRKAAGGIVGKMRKDGESGAPQEVFSEPDSSLCASPAPAASEPDSVPQELAEGADSVPKEVAEGADSAPVRRKTAASAQAKTSAPKTRSGSARTKKAGTGKAEPEA